MLLLKMVTLSLFNIFCKFVEQANRFRGGSKHWLTLSRGNLDALYQIAGVHIVVGIGVLGVEWGRELADPRMVISGRMIVIALLLLASCLSKGIFSGHKPQTPSWDDWDWCFGVNVPNLLGFAAFVYSAFPK
jgi:hypothetical protein